MTAPTDGLTAEQRRIVAWEDGPLVVIAVYNVLVGVIALAAHWLERRLQMPGYIQ